MMPAGKGRLVIHATDNDRHHAAVGLHGRARNVLGFHPQSDSCWVRSDAGEDGVRFRKPRLGGELLRVSTNRRHFRSDLGSEHLHRFNAYEYVRRRSPPGVCQHKHHVEVAPIGIVGKSADELRRDGYPWALRQFNLVSGDEIGGLGGVGRSPRRLCLVRGLIPERAVVDNQEKRSGNQQAVEGKLRDLEGGMIPEERYELPKAFSDKRGFVALGASCLFSIAGVFCLVGREGALSLACSAVAWRLARVTCWLLFGMS